ncbi:MAG TPA: helix-turn-helix transcriptional regulator [Polyangiaceae bacterium]|nr:helix-turn-helix transcriptional regulator [Polyangiaceae bacterium]
MNPHKGSSLRSFFEELGEWDEMEALAQKKIVAETIRRRMAAQHMTKSELAKRMQTSRSQVEALLDTENPGLTMLTLSRASRALGLRAVIQFFEATERRLHREPIARKVAAKSVKGMSGKAARKQRVHAA